MRIISRRPLLKNLNLKMNIIAAENPIPDPNWDYAQIWHELQGSKKELEALLSYIAVIETADDSTDHNICQRIDDIVLQMNSVAGLINETEISGLIEE
jgi:hypothetical protein